MWDKESLVPERWHVRGSMIRRVGCGLLGAAVLVGCGSSNDGGDSGGAPAASADGGTSTETTTDLSTLDLKNFRLSHGTMHTSGIVTLSFDISADGLAAPRDELDFTVLGTGGEAQDLGMGAVEILSQAGGSYPKEPQVTEHGNLLHQVVTYTSFDDATVELDLQINADLPPGEYALDLMRDSTRYPTGISLKVTEATVPDLVLAGAEMSSFSVELYPDGTLRDMSLKRNTVQEEHSRPAPIAATIEVQNLGKAMADGLRVELSASITCDGDDTAYPLAVTARADNVGELFYSPSESFSGADLGAMAEGAALLARRYALDGLLASGEVSGYLPMHVPPEAQVALHALLNAGGSTDCELAFQVHPGEEDGEASNNILEVAVKLLPTEPDLLQDDTWKTVYDILDVWPQASGKWGDEVYAEYDFTPNHLKYKTIAETWPWGVDFQSSFTAGFGFNVLSVSWSQSLLDFAASAVIDGDVLIGLVPCDEDKNQIAASAKVLGNNLFKPVKIITCLDVENTFTATKKVEANWDVAGFKFAGSTIGLTISLGGDMGLSGSILIADPDLAERVTSATLGMGPTAEVAVTPAVGIGIASIEGSLTLIKATLQGSPKLSIHWDAILTPVGAELAIDLPLTLNSMDGKVTLKVGACSGFLKTFLCSSTELASITGWSETSDLYSTSWTFGSMTDEQDQSILPGGSWAQNCNFVSFDQGLLTAICLDTSGIAKDTSLAGCKSFANNNGALECETEWAVPDGPWKESCTLKSASNPDDSMVFPISGVEVLASCPDDTGTMVDTSATGAIELMNVNGVLTSAREVPGGDWANSCNDAEIIYDGVNGDVLSARCLVNGGTGDNRMGVTANLDECPSNNYDYVDGGLVCQS